MPTLPQSDNWTSFLWKGKHLCYKCRYCQFDSMQSYEVDRHAATIHTSPVTATRPIKAKLFDGDGELVKEIAIPNDVPTTSKIEEGNLNPAAARLVEFLKRQSG